MELWIVRKKVPEQPLKPHLRNVTSQFGEDGLIEHILSVINPAEKFCIDVGAWDGKHLSNCYALLQRPDWRGLLIEANEAKFDEMVRNYRDNPRATLVNRFVNFDGPDRLNAILAEERAPKSPALLSIDIDGNDYHVWESLTEFEPDLVVIEFNPCIPNDVVFIQDRSFDVSQGCSLMALILLGKRKGYELAATTAFNALFVKAPHLRALGITNNDIDEMYWPAQDGRIFNGYDGYIHVVGYRQVMWHRVRVGSEDFQILPKESRVSHGARDVVLGEDLPETLPSTSASR